MTETWKETNKRTHKSSNECSVTVETVPTHSSSPTLPLTDFQRKLITIHPTLPPFLFTFSKVKVWFLSSRQHCCCGCLWDLIWTWLGSRDLSCCVCVCTYTDSESLQPSVYKGGLDQGWVGGQGSISLREWRILVYYDQPIAAICEV